MKKQPAQKSYVFDKGYRDVGATFAIMWKRTFAPVSNELRRLRDIFSDGEVIRGIFASLADVIVFGAITLFNIILTSIISVLLISLFLLVAPVVYIGFVLIWLSDLIYRTIKRISNRCPNCQHRFALPIYECPNCGRKHTELIPSSYGIFKRKCDCGAKIPTTFFNGRHKLKAYCPNCRFDVRDGGKHVDVCIPVVGGPSAGKTCYINMAISQLEKTALIKNNLVFEYAFNGLTDYKKTIDDMRNHHRPGKTSDMKLQYDQFYLTPKAEKIKRLISLCDVGGEVYQDDTLIGKQIGYRNADAFIIVVDPLSVREYKKEVEKKFRIDGYNASVLPIDEMLSRLISALENMYSISSKTMLKTDVAVVFTKCDIPGLDEIIGSKAVSRCMHSRGVSREKANNIVCEEFLHKYGEDNFTNNLKSKFKTVQFFTCSSLGYSQNESQYIPDGVEEPVLWIYNRIFG